METSELQLALQNLDNNASLLRQQLIKISSQISGLYVQAENYRSNANAVLSRASYSEDTGQYTELMSQASDYLDRAEYCESSAEQMQSRLERVKYEFRVYRAEYEYYKGEAETNLKNLKSAVEHLSISCNSLYGKDKLNQALNTARQRIVDNQSFVIGCKQKMDWIDQVCGSGGGQFVKKYTRR